MTVKLIRINFESLQLKNLISISPSNVSVDRNFIRFCHVAADGALKSDKVTMSLLSSVGTEENGPVEDLSLMRRSRKSLSLDNLQAVAADDLSPTNDEPGAMQSSESVMYARNMNQSFRAAVDKSFDGPSLAATLAGECDSFTSELVSKQVHITCCTAYVKQA